MTGASYFEAFDEGQSPNREGIYAQHGCHETFNADSLNCNKYHLINNEDTPRGWSFGGSYEDIYATNRTHEGLFEGSDNDTTADGYELDGSHNFYHRCDHTSGNIVDFIAGSTHGNGLRCGLYFSDDNGANATATSGGSRHTY